MKVFDSPNCTNAVEIEEEKDEAIQEKIFRREVIITLQEIHETLKKLNIHLNKMNETEL